MPVVTSRRLVFGCLLVLAGGALELRTDSMGSSYY
eukprot:SAG22_NODE_4722_length_1181_cov_4.177449_1_plen_34_part_10